MYGRVRMWARAREGARARACRYFKKKTEISFPGYAANFHGFSASVRAFSAPELCNLAHTQSSFGHTLIYWREGHSWNLTIIFSVLGS